jgi:4-diphosphocytidyl-2-C-methyl-D-erythritol kinase
VSAAPAAELAWAKVNLALHVTGRRADGYHLLDSLVCFPRIGDRLEAEPAAGLSLALDGPFGQDLDVGPDNLVLRAAAMLRPPGRGAALKLTKSLPVAAGLGGGSADAAAALRLLGRLWGAALPAPGQTAALGADVPVCLAAPRPQRMRGIGERVGPVALPRFWMVLVNPGLPVATGKVFGCLRGWRNPGLAEPPARFGDFGGFVAWLAGQRNDLAAAATEVEPGIAAVLDALAGQEGCALARMSGSGASCFGLFAAEAPALEAADGLRRAAPSWWVAAAPVG